MKCKIEFPQSILIWMISIALITWACSGRNVERVEESPLVLIPDTLPGVPVALSEYGLFAEPLAAMKPVGGILEYEVNASLFSDYALKKRFVYLPGEQSMTYHPEEVFDLPEGALVFKFFYYPARMDSPEEDITVIETRVLEKKEGQWKAYTYVWNESQTDAYLQIGGFDRSIAWINEVGQAQTLDYAVPNMNQCKSCHEFKNALVPIGLTARQINRSLPGRTENQLIHLAETGWLKDLPDIHTIDALADWADVGHATLDARARAYLDSNCGHCHRENGPARNSSLFLDAYVRNPAHLGVGKTPVAAGKGSGGLTYGIVPGKPDESILLYRMISSEPGIMMPELGRKVSHAEGISLIRDWILNMDADYLR
jgi:uncharacterized repeat protein (TIGR03806 family)